MTSRTVRLTCPLDCPDACSLLASVQGDRVTKIAGDPHHPITQGFACSKTYRYPDRAYHPDRPKHPMRRVGAKGAGQWQRVSWDEALDDIAARLQKTLATHGPNALLRYNYAGTMGLHQGTHAHALFRALGAIELEETICATAGSAAWSVPYGDARLAPDPEDLAHTKLIWLWGINSLATNSHLTPFLTKARRNGAKIVHIDPYQNKTSLYADLHLRPKPGTDAALALGIANIIVQRGLHDDHFIAQHTTGFEAYQDATKEWTLPRTAEVTGLDESTIEDLALSYAQTTPSFIRVGYGMTRHAGGGNALQAVVMLPVLTGQWQHRGGGAMLSTSGAFRLERERLGAKHLLKNETRRVNMTQLGAALDPEQHIHALVVYNSNPAVVAPDSQRVLRGLQRQDLFTVVLENAMTETAALADYILPATTFLEHDDLYTAYGHLFLSWNRAAVPPYFESRPNTWVFAELGKRLGVTESSVYWNAEEMARAVLDTPHPFLQGITFERLEQEGFVRLNTPTPFLPYANGAAFQEDGKIKLSPAPRFIAPAATNAEYPLRLLTPPAHHFLNSTYGMLETIRGMEGGEPSVMVHPVDATRYNISDGATTTISSAQGRVVRRAKISEAATPGTVIVEGTWWAKHAPDGTGINALTSQALTDLGAGSTFHDTPVRLEVT